MQNNLRPKASLLPKPVELRDAPVVEGAGRGRLLGIPTLNINLKAAPPSLTHGVYACWIEFKSERHMGAMHFGPRPVFSDSDSFEVHVIDATPRQRPATVDITVVAKLRDIKKFPSAEALKTEIHRDIRQVRAILHRA
ncbi:MAG: riboflavin kinase [Candidatus Peribacteraceae bacterium]